MVCQDEELGASKKWQDVGSAVNGAVASWQQSLQELTKALQLAVGQCQEALLKGSLPLDTNFMHECCARAKVGLAWQGKEFARKPKLSEHDQTTLASHGQANQSSMQVPICTS